MSFAVQTSFYQSYQYRSYSKVNNKGFDSFGSTLSSTAVSKQLGATKGIVLHSKNDADEGEEFAGSWADVQTGVSTSVYKPDDFSEDNPYYHVKIWKPDGTTEERMVDVINFNPKSADSFDHYAFACYLEKEEGMPIQTSMLAQAAKTGDDLYKKRDWIQAYKDMMQQQYDVGYHEGYMRFKKMYERFMEQLASQNVSSDMNISGTSEISDNDEINEELTPLGIGFALAGSMGYGMSASLVTSDATDDTIVRVKVAIGGGNNKEIDVNLSKFDPKKATAVEMFAYCEYKDSIGEGADYTWGSWNLIKSVVSADGMDFGSLENIMNEKIDWTGTLAKSSISLQKRSTGETWSAADLMKLFEEQNKLTAEKLKEDDDWRSMSDDDWDKLLADVDNYIDAYKEDIRERVKKQMEAAQKAALEADPALRSSAAQEAALSVAASGFDGGDAAEDEEPTEATGDDSGIDHEKNWTRKLKTDDQAVLRTAKAAQAMESMVMNRMAEIASAGLSAYGMYGGIAARYMRNRG